jgi:protein-L-isoaspartate(D-aspartate) O-methyltransferase
MEDTYLHKGLRKKLVEEIKSKGIMDKAVLDAINSVPRHFFMDSSFTKFAYKDQAFPIGAGQTISQPYTVAFQTELLKVKAGDRIMEIGTGSGYQAAILVEMGAKVYTIERIRKLMIKARTLLSSLGYNPHFFYGDGYSGLPTFAKFDKILITAATPKIPENLLDQLKTGGRMVLPLGSSYSQVMTLVEKTGENDYKKTEHGYFVFVPMLKGKN